MEFASPRFLDSPGKFKSPSSESRTCGAGGDECGCETKVRVGSERSGPPRLPRHGVGDPGTQRPQALRVPHPGGAQAGLSWLTILRKRENYRRAFDRFDPARVAKYDARKVRSLLTDDGIVRNRLKIRAAVTNAREVLTIQKEFGSFDAYIWRFVGGRPKTNRWTTPAQIPARTEESDAMNRALRERGFGFVGSTICYAYMQAVGMVNDHVIQCFRHREVGRNSHRPRTDNRRR